MVAFTSELSVVVISTSAIAQLQLASLGFSLSAASVPELLIRELEYEYVGVRCDFLSGILAFILASALRVRFALRKAKRVSWVGMWLMFYCATSMLTYSNSYVISCEMRDGLHAPLLGLAGEGHAVDISPLSSPPFSPPPLPARVCGSDGGFTGLLRRRVVLQSQLLSGRILAGPASILSVVALAYAVFVGFGIVAARMLEVADSDGDGFISAQELMRYCLTLPRRVARRLTDFR